MGIVIFSGTTEGRMISEYLTKNRIEHDVCVATNSGEDVMEVSKYARVNVGRLDEREIKSFLRKRNPRLVIDATHPYADVITDNLNRACKELNIENIRVNREVSFLSIEGGSRSYASADECAKALCSESGNIFLTTGSKELECYMRYEELKDRIYVRVLPSVEAIELCKRAGINEKHIIAMYGPHTSEMNEAVIRQFNIKHLVTKESGVTGGFPEKVSAAASSGIRLHIIRRPENSIGISMNECINKINHLFILKDNAIDGNIYKHGANVKLNVKLVGIGPGNINMQTLEAREAIDKADYVFGAKRMLEGVSGDSVKIAEYLPDKIIASLEDILTGRDARALGECDCGIGTFYKCERSINVVAVFSGDTGIYSGAAKLYKKLEEWGKCESLKIIPGISSFSYFASLLGIDYTNAYFESLHGKSEDEDNLKKIAGLINRQEKVFILMSGKSDFEVLKKQIHSDYDREIVIGYSLSYLDQEIIYSSLHNLDNNICDLKDGLFIVLVGL